MRPIARGERSRNLLSHCEVRLRALIIKDLERSRLLIRVGIYNRQYVVTRRELPQFVPGVHAVIEYRPSRPVETPRCRGTARLFVEDEPSGFSQIEDVAQASRSRHGRVDDAVERQWETIEARRKVVGDRRRARVRTVDHQVVVPGAEVGKIERLTVKAQRPSRHELPKLRIQTPRRNRSGAIGVGVVDDLRCRTKAGRTGNRANRRIEHIVAAWIARTATRERILRIVRDGNVVRPCNRYRPLQERIAIAATSASSIRRRLIVVRTQLSSACVIHP